MSRRIEKVNELMRHEIGSWLSRTYDPPSGCVVTIEEVKTSPDLGHTKVFLSVLPIEQNTRVLAQLHALRGDVRKYLYRRLTMKFVPIVHFVGDEREARAERIHRLLDTSSPG